MENYFKISNKIKMKGGVMKKRKFYETVYTKQYDIILSPVHWTPNYEVRMEAYERDTKKRVARDKRIDFDGYYFKSELKRAV